MPWFRWLKKSTDEAADHPAETHERAGAPTDAPAPEPVSGDGDVQAPTETAQADGETEGEAAKRKRRRGSRGGRKRKPGAAGGDAAAESDDDGGAERAPEQPRRQRGGGERAAKDAGAKEKEEGAKGDRRDGQRKRSSSSQQRRKQAPRRVPLPEAKREVLISVDVGEQRVAILEDDQVAEVYLERPESRSIVGNIYLGTVDNVLPGMEAAFVEIGLEKNGFLYVDEIVVPELEGKRHGKKIQDLISRGEKILVQAVKDPMKTKGARLTTEISLPGRFLVLVPNGEGLGVSRRLEDAERQRLKDILKPIAPKEGGVIVRTAAEGASAEDVERDLVFLQRLWKTIQTRSESAKAPELVYQEAELPLRIVRDLFAGDFLAAHVDNERTHKRIVGYLKKTSPHMVDRVHRWKEKERLFEQYGVEREIASTLDRRVDLPSGGYLIFDYAEAFTVIDVNTGRFVGSRSKNSTQRLEDTIVKNNLEAVKEVVRQLRLRDIGGIIVIDFIDMANQKNRAAVEEALRSELERDRTKTYVVEISPLGLVEMTRQNVTDGPREVMTRKCPTCGGDGIVVSDQTLAMQVERRLRALAAGGAGSRVQAYTVAVHPRTLAILAGPGGERLAALEEATRRRFFLVPAEGHAHGDHLEVLAEGKLADLQPESPLAEGAQIEVKLVEVGLHDPSAGVGKVDGIDVIVADAAKLVGKKATVSLGRVLVGQAFAELVTADGVAAAITFESEAEKPTRAPARRKPAEDAGADDAAAQSETGEDAASDGLETGSPSDDLGEADGDEETDDDAGADGAVGPDGLPVKKKTRRGSRGGRRRKKRPTDAEGLESADGTEAVAAPTGDDEDGVAAEPVEPDGPVRAADAEDGAKRPRARRAPRIHVPDDREAADEEPSRPTAAAAVEAAEPVVDDAEGDAAEGGDADGSEPAAPRKRTRRGSRGGRNRRKRPAGAATDADGLEGEGDPAEDDGDAADDATDTAADEGADVVEVAAESPTVTEDEPVAKPRAPRRSRARAVAAEPAPADEPADVADAADGAPADVEPAEAAPVAADAAPDEPAAADAAPDEPADAAPDGYVPMSQWIDDFEASRGRD